jgi:hypothetical protein
MTSILPSARHSDAGLATGIKSPGPYEIRLSTMGGRTSAASRRIAVSHVRSTVSGQVDQVLGTLHVGLGHSHRVGS